MLILIVCAFYIYATPAHAVTNQWDSITPSGTSGYVFNTLAGIGSHLFLATDHGVYKSTDAGQSWTQVNIGLGPHLSVTSLAIGWIYDSGASRYATTSSTYIFAGTSDGGIFASTLSNPVWVATSTGLTDNSILDIAVDQYQATQGSFTTLYVATPSGVFISTTTGSYWRADNAGLSGYAKKLATAFGSAEIIALTDGNDVYSSTLRSSSGTYENWSRTFRSNGTTTNDVTVLHTTGNVAWIAADTGIYKSNDGGLQFASSSTGLPSGSVRTVASDYSDSNIAYAAVYGSGIYRTTHEAIPNADQQIPQWLPIHKELSDLAIKKVVTDPYDSGVVYAVGDAGVYKLAYSGTPIELIDLTKPSTVSDLSVTSLSNIGTTTLLWTAPGNNGRYGTSTAYEIRYSTSTEITSLNFSSSNLITVMPNPLEGYGPNQLQPVPKVSGTHEVYNINLPALTQTYYFALIARDAAGNSSSLSNTVVLDLTPPTEPQSLSAHTVSSSNIRFSWGASTDLLGVEGYRVYGCRGSACSPAELLGTTNSDLSFSHTGLSAANTYGYMVVAYDAVSNSATSSVVYAVTSSVSSSGSSSSGGGGGWGGGGGGGASPTAPAQVPAYSIPKLPSAKTLTQIPASYMHLKIGSRNDSVLGLQKFLVTQGYMPADLITGYFGPITDAAVKKFTTDSVTLPKISPTSGAPTVVSQPSTPLFTYQYSTLQIGMKSAEVLELQKYIAGKGYMDQGLTTGYFGPITAAAFARYQADMTRNQTLGGSCPVGMVCTPIVSVTVASTSLAEIVTTFTPLSTFLALGSRHSDVLTLQRFLNNNHFTVALSGPGSSGNETDFFGPATQAAVIRFQQAKASQLGTSPGLPESTGFVGAKTIQLINSLLNR